MDRKPITKEEIEEERRKRRKADPKTKFDKPTDPADDTYKDAGQVDPKRAREDKQ